ncbi:dual specificity protein phosphatase Mpk3 [Drosophila madeirensis]|uniref:Dual specificity protein phosphatase n=1 Tax=Drosophila madeirensis TaxID=30013 RepID=A0AAU9FN71_DROMD
MPETEHESCSKEWLQAQLRSLDAKELILLDCRGSHEYSESHIRGAVNLCIPSIVLRRLATGKIDLASTIKSPDLKDRIQTGYKLSLFILYNGEGVAGQQDVAAAGMGANDSIINILHRRLKQDGCRVVALQDGFSSFRLAFPEWCEDDSQSHNKEMESSRNVQTDQLMGLRSLRISTPHSDSACSSSAESSDCESTSHHHYHHHHHSYNEAPVEIIKGLLFLGNAAHSGDSKALQKYNIKYVLNVTPDLPNEFEKSGIKYLQIPITDHYSQDLAMHFPDAIHFIEEARSANSAVLVHCLAGVSRSVTVTLAYLMHTRGLSLNDAFMMVRDRKPDVSPNFHFMQQLESFESQLRLSPGDGQAMDEGGCSMMGGMEPPISSSVSNSVLMANNPSVVASRCGGRSSKFSCNCIAPDCKCMQTGGFMAAHLAKATGVSPDSGIEFDRWTPSSDTGLK